MESTSKSPLIIISGPTASGKTYFSLKLANLVQEKFQKKASIVNFDSLLFYQELNIGTAKPSLKERGQIEHRLVGNQSAKDPINASDFVAMAKKEIETGLKEGKVIFLVGGSAFYLRALIKGMYEAETTPLEIKKELENLYEAEGINPIIEILKKNDPEILAKLHINDHYRLTRAAEFFLTTGKKISIEKKKMDDKNPYDLSSSDWNILHLYLNPPKDSHLQIIEKRTKEMVDLGLIEEVTNLLKSGFSGEEKPLKSIGYKETLSYLEGSITDLESLTEKIVISTRQLAKSQRTFFKKITPKVSYDSLQDEEQIISDVCNFLKQHEFGQA